MRGSRVFSNLNHKSVSYVTITNCLYQIQAYQIMFPLLQVVARIQSLAPPGMKYVLTLAFKDEPPSIESILQGRGRPSTS